MHLESLSLRNFRNYETLDLKFEPSGSLFLGGNAQGKTNLLEAIHCLGTARSQRQARDGEIIQRGTDFFVLKGTGRGEKDQRITVEIRAWRQGERQLKINGAVYKKISDLMGLIPIVDLSPEDVAIVAGSPQKRRRFLNLYLCQISSSYWVSLTEYARILQQRNIALRSRSGRRWLPADADEMSAWDQQLVTVGAGIIRRRGDFLKALNPQVQSFYGHIAGADEQITLLYQPSVHLDEEQNAEQYFQRALERAREKERQLGMTMAGPHRDEVVIVVNGMDLRTYGSQGQQRTAAIALKLAAARLLERAKGEQPILLLDDVFAELDVDRTRLLFRLLGEFGQVFIATAKESDLAGCGQNLPRLAVSHGEAMPC